MIFSVRNLPYLVISIIAICVSSLGQEQTVVEADFDCESFFNDTVFSVRVVLPELVEEPMVKSTDALSILSVELSEEEPFVATIKMLPLQTGLVSVPSFIFTSEKAIYQTKQKTISVTSPQQSSDLSFTITPVKQAVFVGEPLRCDVVWRSGLRANQIRSLDCYPEIFTWDHAKIVIPRSIVDKDQQLGVPFGGRRIIAQRLIPDEDRNVLGEVRFPLYIRFDKPGQFLLPATRLEIAYLKESDEALAPYTAYFNNGLFKSRSELGAFDRLYTESEQLAISVKALPVEGQTEFFSGLFTPCKISASTDIDKVTVGGVTQLKLRVETAAPHEMVFLPNLGIQQGLRSRFRWGEDYGRNWLINGTEFSGRLRPLTTDVSAIPSLQFQVFNPDSGKYEVIQTEALPLEVLPQKNGQSFYDVRAIAPETNLTNQPEGVWHNTQPGFMSNLINAVIHIFASYFWLLLSLGPIVFLLLYKRVREARKRSVDARYRKQAEAYERFVSVPENGIEKWQAFQTFVATGCGISSSALTWGDALDRLEKNGVDNADIDKIISIHQQMDAVDYSSQKSIVSVPELNPIAERLFSAFKKAIITFAICLSLGEIQAGDWSEAEQFFTQAIESPAGEPATIALFTQSALKFEAAASAGEKVGYSWANAGNAWFKAGELGRAISCYRQARIYRPFDSGINTNLKTVRALCVDVVEDQGGVSIASFPVRWLAVSLVLLSWVVLVVALLCVRYQNLVFKIAFGIGLVLLLLNGIWMMFCSSKSGTEGVVIAKNVYARKGPSYNYEKAFNEALHDGLEFRIIEHHADWLQIALADQRVAWLPKAQVRVLLNERH